jgi:hypothetical protein
MIRPRKHLQVRVTAPPAETGQTLGIDGFTVQKHVAYRRETPFGLAEDDSPEGRT